MNINTVEIDRILEQLALQDAYRFNAYQISALVGEKDVDLVNKYLMFKAHFGVLEAIIEFLCPNNDPDFQIILGKETPSGIRECRICDKEYTPDLDYSHIVFYFKRTYIEDLKKKDRVPLREKQAI
ncbi:hypothetical protein [Paenibacillus sp. SI8]|uniref:hypothetical protein n=1 Tax=unclassified Paenibacillus TaxID=185978 RepID=UPI003465F8D2